MNNMIKKDEDMQELDNLFVFVIWDCLYNDCRVILESYIDGLVQEQDCCISVDVMQLQSCTKRSTSPALFLYCGIRKLRPLNGEEKPWNGTFYV